MILRTQRMLVAVVVMAVEAGCGVTCRHAPARTAPAFAVHAIMLPGAAAGGVVMDYLAYDRAHRRLWVPAGNTGSVDVVDATDIVEPRDNRVSRIEGFVTATIERQGTTRIVGPSSATVGDGVVYVGNRGDASLCAVDAQSLQRGPCLALASMPDGLAYVASTREVWVTTPRDQSITVIDAVVPGVLTRTAQIRLEGAPEGFAVDDNRGVFYTNLEDRDLTLTIDIRSRQVIRTWRAGCGESGPRGLALDRGRNVLVVACTDHVQVFDVAHDGAPLSTLAVGDGVDNIDYVEPRHELYVAAARAATLTIARLDRRGTLTPVARVATASGARNAVATDEGTAFVTDSAAGKILVVMPVAAH